MKDCRYRGLRGFTIVELMISVFMFGMILTAIYMTWIAILKGKKVSLDAAAEVQRSRIAVRTIEDALLTAQFFNENLYYYAFMADTTGDMAYLTLVARLPATFPGVGRYGDQVVRRVSFFVQPGFHGKELVMSQSPMLMDTNSSFKPYTLTLARNVTEFTLEFYNLELGEWENEWLYTNQLPGLVNVTLGQRTTGTGSASDDVVSRVISVPALAVANHLGGRPARNRPPSPNERNAPPPQLGPPR